MTFASNAAGELLLFQFGNGANPEVYTASCSINTDRSLDATAQVYTGEIPDCDNPSNPNKTIRRIKSIDHKFTGAGIANLGDFQTLYALFIAGQPFDGIVKQNIAGAQGWSLSGKWVIESLKLTGKQHEDQTFDITLGQADVLAFAASN